MVNPLTFWRDRAVLVTGHTGFKGAWLSLWLSHLGARVTGLSLPPETAPNLFDLAALAARVTSTFGDIRDAAVVSKAVERSQPEVIFHLAAQPLVRRSYVDPVSTYATNVMGTIHVLEAARRAQGLRATIVVTSDKCYENREWVWPYREDDALGGHDPYSSSKACTEIVTSAWRRSYFAASGNAGSGVASGRAGNVIGGGDWAEDRLVPDCVRAFQAARPVVIRNPMATRPWQHVLDPLLGYLLLAERVSTDASACSEAFNFGPVPEDAASVATVVDRLARLWGDGAAWQQDAGFHPHEARALQVDASKARAVLGWQPRLTLDLALEWTAVWYRRVAAGEDAAQVTLEQIDTFSTLGTAR